MSKTISANLKAHLAQETTTLATLWKITRPDGTIFAFTDHDEDVTYDDGSGDGSLKYEAATGFMPTATDSKIDLSVDNLEVTSFLDSERVKESDIEAGLFDYSDLDVYIVNYESLSDGHLTLAGGWKIGEITIRDNHYVAEVRSKAQLLTQEIVDFYSPGCRVDLGDSYCQVDVAGSFTFAGTVTYVDPHNKKSVFVDHSRTEKEDFFIGGKVTFVTGNNAGYEMEVKNYTWAQRKFVLFLDMPNDIQVGDTFNVTYGCDKAMETCRDTFSNIENFRGEPYLPGLDQLRDYKIPET